MTPKESFLMWFIVAVVNIVAAIALWMAANAAGFLLPD